MLFKSVLLGCCVLFSVLGCSGQKLDSKPTISIWHWMTDRDAAFQELAKKYETLTGVKVNFELYAPSDAYAQKIRAAAQGINLPDVFSILGQKQDFVSFIKAGHVLDLTAYMEADNNSWKNSFFPKALTVNEFGPQNSYGINPGIFGVPIDIMTIQMVYNKKLFTQLGLNPNRPPKTLSEFLDTGAKIQAVGLQGLVSGWGEIWMIDCLANNYAFNLMGKDKVLATIKGEVPYTDPDWVEVFTIFKQMKDSGILARGLVTMINKTAEQLFANEKAVFAFNGSWCANVYQGMNPGLEYGAMLPPQASDKFPMAIWGGAGSSFMVNARSKHKEEAVKFLIWLTDQDQQAYLSAATNNLPANKNSLSKIPAVLAQFARGMDYATHPNVWGVSEFSLVIEAFDYGIQSIIIGEKTPEQVAKEVQQVKERELAKKRKN
ncbi:MAG: extracellular solute-binding protein [Candidatus Omnitrophica bacterium]|nr:extracellular solute-binding protein [Candidatus Omnitrophota bacterium]MBU4303260.1 extracellular solute-binding protein [Candidatus Omnitrophota bacterium]MBU4418299.1 extracellular solute-binding protein [Candidatus Omnitrophota bacterium]MBU4468368.1 extracellular solute-binding protein [Candidatus Omnitrophota bacterium]MCG2708209.1 extracellular solute-binding protein [Candidatus Omnitrophota bacterium]